MSRTEPASESIRLAAICASPVFLDPAASTDKACKLIDEAGRAGVHLAAFGETWLSGYPTFVLAQTPFADSPLPARYLASAIEVPGPETDQLCAAAKQAGVDVVIGVSERDQRTNGTVYCTLVFIGSDGVVLGKHRKLKPTHPERMAWGEGDGSSLVTYEREYGRLSGLNCWEHVMMLPGYALVGQGTQFHVATWPVGGGLSKSLILARAFAVQAACYVISVGGHYPLEMYDENIRDRVVPMEGPCHIIDPDGGVVASVEDGEGMAIADADPERIRAAKVHRDIAGHYSRPDVLQLRVNRQSRRPIVVDGDESRHDGVDPTIETRKALVVPAAGLGQESVDGAPAADHLPTAQLSTN